MSGDHSMNQTSPGWRKRQIMDMESKGTSMTKDEALQMCLEYIETDAHERKYVRHAIKKALAQPEQDTVQRLSALVRAQQITIDKLEARPEQEPDVEKYLCAFCRTHFPEPLKPNLRRKNT